jgi:hypothetical protein
MITPQEKAKELIDKMYNTDDPMGNYPMCFDTAKQCALIAVEEILASHYKVLTGINNSILEYWLEVQQEIQKLCK